ncbi:MAG: hypothetical protein IPL39_14515 [Opitutaceae bacterium]|nr:hypothetical protein [Opitutaceae bacterium]
MRRPTQLDFANGVALVVALLLVVVGLSLSGCATARTAWHDLVGSPADKAQKADTKVAQAEVKVDAAKAGLVDAAHVKVAMAELLSRHVAEQSKVADSLRTTLSGAKADLDTARGALPPDELAALRQTVDQLRSTNATLQAAGEKAIAALEVQSGEFAAILRAAVVAADAARARADKADAAALDWARERDATARRWERLWFWIWIAAGAWIAAQVLPLLARLVPAIAPAATAIAAIASPISTYALGKAKALAKDASSALHNVVTAVHEKAPGIVDQVERIKAEWITPEDGTTTAYTAALREAQQI